MMRMRRKRRKLVRKVSENKGRKHGRSKEAGKKEEWREGKEEWKERMEERRGG